MDRDTALKLLESQHTFPSDHLFHVIVHADEAQIAVVTIALADRFSLDSLEERLVSVPSSKGKYVSLRVRLPCATASDVLDVYALLASMKQVVRYF